MKVKPVVKAIILNRKLGKILLVQRSGDDKTGPNEWENAGGSVEENEDLISAVKREIREETRITDLIINEPPCYTAVIDKSIPDIIYAYLCETQTEDVKVSEGHRAYKWVDKEECRNILRGGIAMDFINHGIYDLNWK